MSGPCFSDMKTPREKLLFRQFVEAAAAAPPEACIAGADAGDARSGEGRGKPYKDMFEAEQAAKVALKQQVMTSLVSLGGDRGDGLLVGCLLCCVELSQGARHVARMMTACGVVASILLY